MIEKMLWLSTRIGGKLILGSSFGHPNSSVSTDEFGCPKEDPNISF